MTVPLPMMEEHVDGAGVLVSVVHLPSFGGPVRANVAVRVTVPPIPTEDPVPPTNVTGAETRRSAEELVRSTVWAFACLRAAFDGERATAAVPFSRVGST